MDTFTVTSGPSSVEPAKKIFFLRSGTVRILFIAMHSEKDIDGRWNISGHTKSPSREKIHAHLTYCPATRTGTISYP